MTTSQFKFLMNALFAFIWIGTIVSTSAIFYAINLSWLLSSVLSAIIATGLAFVTRETMQEALKLRLYAADLAKHEGAHQ